MSVPVRANKYFLAATCKPQFDQYHEMAKGLVTLQDLLKSYGALESFGFRNCALDQDDGQLYARLQIRQDADPASDIYLSRIDLSDMVQVIEHNRPKVSQMSEDWQAFMTRLDAVTQTAVKVMEMHTKTVEWVKARDAAAQAPGFRHTA